MVSGPPIPSAALRFLKYVEANPTAFHVVATSVAMLERAGFVQLHEKQSWDQQLELGGRYYYQRNQSSLVAFAIGKQYKPGNGVHMVGAHTDSPNLRVRPISTRSKEGYLQCSIETYGGGLWATWFDRDLSLAGRVIIATSDEQKQFVSRLVFVRRPLLRIPTLAIHLDRTANESFKFNQEDNFQPVFGLEEALNSSAQKLNNAESQAEASSPASKHHPLLLQLLAEELNCKVSHIQDFELSLYDTQAPAAGGIMNEFLFTPRVDNQMSCFCATEGLIDSVKSNGALDKSDSIRAIALFDNEEVGSVSNQGAESNLVWSLVHRLASLVIRGAAGSTNDMALFDQSLANSFLISSDTAHAVHPNYASIHEQNLRPKINAGPVIKTNSKQRYASTAVTTFLIRRIAKLADVPLQEFEVRNDCPCGSTIGPMLSKMVRTVDLGNPQLSMHSIREMCGSHDVERKIRLFAEFFRSFSKIDQELVVD